MDVGGGGRLTQGGGRLTQGGGRLPHGGGRLARRGLRLIAAHDVAPAALLRFEGDNREYFARLIPDRGDDYYALATVTSSLAAARGWWESGSDRMHVVVDAAGNVVARVNLVHIAGGRAELGYRVAGSRAGDGLATDAVAEVLVLAPAYGIEEVSATTTEDNVASARVLERCGFAEQGRRAAALRVGDRDLDAIDWILPAPPADEAAR